MFAQKRLRTTKTFYFSIANYMNSNLVHLDGRFDSDKVRMAHLCGFTKTYKYNGFGRHVLVYGCFERLNLQGINKTLGSWFEIW
jgi:hypothetical protein